MKPCHYNPATLDLSGYVSSLLYSSCCTAKFQVIIYIDPKLNLHNSFATFSLWVRGALRVAMKET